MIGNVWETSETQVSRLLESIANQPEPAPRRVGKHGRKGRPTQPKGGRKGRGYRAHAPRGHRYAAAEAGRRRPGNPRKAAQP